MEDILGLSLMFGRCPLCGAMIYIDEGEERPSEDERLHAEWHESLDLRLDDGPNA